MLNTWKILPLAVFAALGALMLLPDGGVKPAAVSAYDCDDTGTLRINIEDEDTGDEITVAGAVVLITPNTQTGSGNDSVTDNSSEDDSTTIGRIEQDDTCSTELVEVYNVQLVTLPEDLEDCDIEDASESGTLSAGSTLTLTLRVNCEDVDLVTPTGTTGAASTVVVQSANTTLGCGSTTIITITVRGSNGQPVANGTLVNITANIGSVSPTSGQTTADGSVFVFYTAPQTQGGAATITAASGTATGTVNIAVNCTTAPTQAPPPTTAPAGNIQPPNTGDGGIASSGSWHTYAGIALIVASVIATLVVVRPRA